MVAKLRKVDLITDNPINHTVLFTDSSRPVSGQRMFERFWFSKSLLAVVKKKHIEPRISQMARMWRGRRILTTKEKSGRRAVAFPSYF
jgi:hypothetical protein